MTDAEREPARRGRLVSRPASADELGHARGEANAEAANATAARELALRFLAPRPRSEREIRQRLQRGGFSPEAIEAALDEVRRLGLVDDVAFARYWAEQRRTFRPRGARLLAAELRQHGVEAALVADVVAEGEPAAEADAYRVASKRARQLQSADERTFRTRLSQLLARRGFAWDVIQPTVERLYRERNA